LAGIKQSRSFKIWLSEEQIVACVMEIAMIVGVFDEDLIMW
jgi:hypothetical protein